jgi:SNF2 family DNA or RNA helicase
MSRFIRPLGDRIRKFLEYANLETKPHQVDGIKWCVKREALGLGQVGGGILGGIVADEMGLGKTILMIGLMAVNKKPNTLIVLPPILISQWSDQIYKMTGHRALIYHGQNKKKVTLTSLNDSRVVLTSYNAVAINKKHTFATTLLHSVEWSRIIFDEAHHLRNKNTSVFNGASMLNSSVRWMVTGTPVQNRMKDFYNLCTILKLEPAFYRDSANYASFMIKRTKISCDKEDVIGLVSQASAISWANKEEEELSLSVHENLNNAASDKLVWFLKARQVCVLPQLVDTRVMSTSKLDYVCDFILSKKNDGNGKLVFCSFRKEIDMVYQKLVEGGAGSVVILDGRVSPKQRSLVLAAKNDVMIVQINTGCEGLNLQEHYSEVYFVSPHWNPSVEDQAVARCHRFGQTKCVNVHRFHMSQDESMDQFIATLQGKKRMLYIQPLEKVEPNEV